MRLSSLSLSVVFTVTLGAGHEWAHAAQPGSPSRQPEPTSTTTASAGKPEPSACGETESNRITLGADGATTASVVTWDNRRPGCIVVEGLDATAAAGYRLGHEYADTIGDPVELDTTVALSQGSHRPASLRLEFPVAAAPSKRVLVFNLWKVVPGPVSNSSAALQRRGALKRLLDRDGGAKARANTLADVAKKRGTDLDVAKRDLLAARQVVVNLTEDAKIYASAGAASSTQLSAAMARLAIARDDVVAKDEAVRKATISADEAVAAAREAREGVIAKYGDLWAAQAELESLSNVSDNAAGNRLALLKVGAAIVGTFDRAVTYALSVSAEAGPTTVSLRRLSDYPRVTPKHALFVVIANRALSSHPHPFGISTTKTVSSPPNISPVRPTFGLPEVKSGDTHLMMLGKRQDAITWPMGTGGVLIPVDAASRLTALRDTILTVGERFGGNEVPVVTITTWAPTRSLSTKTSTVDGKEEESVTDSAAFDTVNLLDKVPFPQVRALYRYNFATGVIASELRDEREIKVKAVANVPPPPGEDDAEDETRYAATTLTGSRRVSAAGLFSVYLRPVDLQAPFFSADSMRWLPAPTVGVSVVNPTDNLFVGATVEVLPNVHLFGGKTSGKVERLVPADIDEDRQPDPRATDTRRVWAWSWGVSFNINIVKALFQ